MRVQGLGCCEVLCPIVLLQLKNGGVAKVKGEGEKEKECTTECKSRRRRNEKAPWALLKYIATVFYYR